MGNTIKAIGFWSPLVIVVIIGTWGNYIITQQGEEIRKTSTLANTQRVLLEERTVWLEELRVWRLSVDRDSATLAELARECGERVKEVDALLEKIFADNPRLIR